MSAPPLSIPAAFHWRLLIAMLLAFSCLPLATLHAQPVPQHEPQGTREVQSDSTAQDDSTELYTRIRLSSLTFNGTYLPRTFDPMSLPPFVFSFDYILDLDIYSIRSASVGSSSALGIRLGYGIVAWTIPDVQDDKYYEYFLIGMVDKDLLSRYSMYGSRSRLDFLLGVTVRRGDHYVDDREPFTSATVMSRDAAVKLGAEYSFAIWNPVLSFHLRAGCVLFGYKTFETGSIGIGISLGYRRYFNPAAK